ncbi:MAG TPA: serine hydrolase domain-containing protein [Terracidiphilus sp.]|jgi:CubicO group peptidase (beta-lactamase class C family)
MRSRLLVSLALSILFSASLFSQAPKPSTENLPARVDAIFQKMDSTVSPGCALSVVKDGKIIYERGYGMADLDHNIAITPTTVFHVASMSKQFTAASILLLAQQGKLSLDDPVRKYIPELPDFGTPVTIRQLIHHTSGLRDQWDLLGLSGWRYSLDLITNDDVLYVISHQKELNFPPGTKHLYSNTGYTLLGEVVKRVSGKSLHEFTTENIFRPLGMKNTHFRDDHAEIIKNIAYGYGPAGDTFRLSVTNFDTVGATSLMTTVEDLPLWDENFYNPRIGGPDLIRQMLERGKLNNGEQLDYASGLVIGKYRGLNTVDHGGADAGYRSDMIRFPDQHFSSACLCNLATADPSDLNRKVAEIYLKKEMTPAEPAHVADEKPVQLTPQQLSAIAGTYLNQDDEVIRVFLKDNALRVANANEDQSYELMPLAPNHFRLMVAPVDFTFDAPEGKNPARITIKSPDGKPDVNSAVTPFTPSEADLKPYAGTYSSEDIDPLYTIAIEKGKLVLHRLKNDPDKLMPVTPDLFVASLGSIRFTRSAKGEITGFFLTTGRIRNMRFTKGRPAIAAQ